MDKISFRERVRNVSVENAKKYKETFIDYEYLIFSKKFKYKDYYIIKSDTNNYLHLIGVNTKLSPKEFYDKCINEKLEINDFDFIKRNKSEKSVKGSVREKIGILPEMSKIFNDKITVEEKYKHNKIECVFATSDKKLTLGFAESGRPKTLLKGNKLHSENEQNVDLILRRRRGEKKFNKVMYGDVSIVKENKKIRQLVYE